MQQLTCKMVGLFLVILFCSLKKSLDLKKSRGGKSVKKCRTDFALYLLPFSFSLKDISFCWAVQRFCPLQGCREGVGGQLHFYLPLFWEAFPYNRVARSGAVRLGFGGGTVQLRAVPVFGSGGSSGEGFSLYFSTS